MKMITYNHEEHGPTLRKWWRGHWGVEGPHDRYLRRGRVLVENNTPMAACFLFIDDEAKQCQINLLVSDPDLQETGKYVNELCRRVTHELSARLGVGGVITVFTHIPTIAQILENNGYERSRKERVYHYVNEG